MDLKAVMSRQPVANPGFPRQGAPRGANPLNAGCETVSRQRRMLQYQYGFHFMLLGNNTSTLVGLIVLTV